MNILDYALLHGFNPKYAASTEGGEYKGHCPSCGVQKDHCAYWPNHPKTKHKGGSYWCRDCDSKGDLLALVMMLERVDYKEACRIAGQQPKESGGGRHNHPVKSTPARREMKVAAMNGGDTWLNSADAFVDQSSKNLWKNPEALARLQQSKFLTQKTIARYRIGYNETAMYVDRSRWGLSEELNDKGRPKKIWLPRGIVIPRYSHDGKLCGIKIRRPEEDLRNKDDPRYVFVPGGSNSLMFCGKNRSSFIVVESELDAIFLAQEGVGLLSAVALGSAANWPDQESFELLKRANKIFLCLDSDNAGKNKKKIEEWVSILPNLSCLYLPSSYGKDATDAAKNGFPIRAWLEEAVKRAAAESRPEATPSPEINNDFADHTSPAWQRGEALTDDQLLIIQAVELEAKTSAAGMIEVAYQLDRALGTFDQTGEIAVDRGFARSVLRSAIDRATAALKFQKMDSSPEVAA